MYGMIARALRDMVIESHGEERWTATWQRAGLEDDEFLSMGRYPDEMTYGLVMATAAELDLPPAAVLEALGRHWIPHADRHFAAYMNSAGNTLEFIEQLDRMHANIRLAYPELVPPQFDVHRDDTGRMRVDYLSTRTGLEALARGMLAGLADRFGERFEIEKLASDLERPGHRAGFVMRRA